MGRAQGNPHQQPPSVRGSTPTPAVLEGEWAAADATAPRRQCVSLPSADHPEHNEDRVLCDPALGIAAVFDGMGGEAGGEMAARAACGAFAEEIAYLPADVSGRRDWLVRAVAQAANAVGLSKRLHKKEAHQGATAAAAVLAADTALVVSVGDSRIYRYSGGTLSCLNAPHSADPERQRRLEALDEVTTFAELAADPALHAMFYARHIIDVELGTLKTTPTLTEHKLSAGDLLLVCSDGVSDNLTGYEMAEIIRREAGHGPTAVAASLAAAASRRAASRHQRAKPDDISIACLLANF